SIASSTTRAELAGQRTRPIIAPAAQATSIATPAQTIARGPLLGGTAHAGSLETAVVCRFAGPGSITAVSALGTGTRRTSAPRPPAPAPPPPAPPPRPPEPGALSAPRPRPPPRPARPRPSPPESAPASAPPAPSARAHSSPRTQATPRAPPPPSETASP